MAPHTVTNEDPVDLGGTLDTTQNLQFLHSTTSLANCDQTLIAAHDDYNEPGGIVRVKLLDFSSGGNSWQITANHDRGSTTWSRDSTHAYFDFGPDADVEVDILAVSDESPPQSKTRKIYVKTQPTDPLPDGR